MPYTFQIRSKRYFIRHINPVIDTLPYFRYINSFHVHKSINANAYGSIDKARRDLYYFSLFDGINDLCLGIADESNKLIGTVGYNRTSVGYEVVGDLDCVYWGRGIMRYAGYFLINYCRSLCIHILYAKVLTENKRAINLLNRFGCSIVETVEQNGKWCYLVSLSI